MKTIIFLFATVLLASCYSTSTTMQQKIVVTQVKPTKHGVRIKSKRVTSAVPIPANLYKVGDTLNVLSQQR